MYLRHCKYWNIFFLPQVNYIMVPARLYMKHHWLSNNRLYVHLQYFRKIEELCNSFKDIIPYLIGCKCN